MKVNKTAIALLVSAGLVAGCAGVGGESTEQKQQRYQQALSAADAAYQKVYSVGFAWTNSEDLMKAANKAVEKGEWDKAISLAEEAKTISELAYNQYLEQRDAGKQGIR